MRKFISAITLAAALLFVAGNLGAQERTGTDATVTQAASVTTGVTINGSSGVITCFTSTQAAAAAAPATFTVTNPAVTPTSAVVASVAGYAGTTGTPQVRTNAIAAGSFDIIVTNVHPTAALNGVVKVAFRF